jgi:hypothetical protein
MITGLSVDVMATSVVRFACGRIVNYHAGYPKAHRAYSPPWVADERVLPSAMIILTVFFGKRKAK